MLCSGYSRGVHRTAVATALIALLPIAVGSLVTTMKAGMAFLDWPSSDGHSMFAYPLFRANGNQFVEHSHRLAGMLIGFLSIALFVMAILKEKRLWVKLLTGSVLLGVIAQGLLGGLRVLENRPDLAMWHGNFAACLFTLMLVIALVTSRRWFEVAETVSSERNDVSGLKPFVFLLPAIVYGQYLLGGRQRHLHDFLYEHVAIAALVFLLVVATVIAVYRNGDSWLRRSARSLSFCIVLQICLGLGSWATKFGVQTVGYVAVQGSWSQLLVRSSHTIIGMFLLANSVLLLVRVLRLDRVFMERFPETVFVPSAGFAAGSVAKGDA